MKCSFLLTTVSFTLANIPLEREKTNPSAAQVFMLFNFTLATSPFCLFRFLLEWHTDDPITERNTCCLTFMGYNLQNCSGYKVQYKCKISLALLLCKYSMVNKKHSFSLMKQLLFVTYLILK